MSEFIRLQANGVDAYPDASTENTYRSNGTSVESALLALESNVNTLGGVAGEAKTLAEQNSVKIATAEQEISDINSSLSSLNVWKKETIATFDYGLLEASYNEFLHLVSIRFSGNATNTPSSEVTVDTRFSPQNGVNPCAVMLNGVNIDCENGKIHLYFNGGNWVSAYFTFAYM